MNLSPRSMILLTLAAYDGRVEGKTLLQKRLYFLDQLLQLKFGESAGFEHDSHYYGPFSTVVGDELVSLQGLGFVQELSESVPLVQTGFFEPRRYTYHLTPAGEGAVKNLRAGHPDDVSKVDQALAPIMALQGVDYVQLSIAAKCHLILKRGGQPLSPGAVVEAARGFSWQVTTEQVQGGFQLLQQLGLAPQAPATAATN